MGMGHLGCFNKSLGMRVGSIYSFDMTHVLSSVCDGSDTRMVRSSSQEEDEDGSSCRLKNFYWKS